MDLADVHANVDQGCHIASMGGTWMAAVYGIGGMREQNGRITFHPRLGRRLEGLRFHLAIRGQLLTVNIEGHKRQVTYLLRRGSGLTIGHVDEELKLEPGKPVSREFHEIPDRTSDGDPQSTPGSRATTSPQPSQTLDNPSIEEADEERKRKPDQVIHRLRLPA